MKTIDLFVGLLILVGMVQCQTCMNQADAATFHRKGTGVIGSITFSGTVQTERGMAVNLTQQSDGTMLATYEMWENHTADAFRHKETIEVHSGETTAVAINGMELEIRAVPDFAYAEVTP